VVNDVDPAAGQNGTTTLYIINLISSTTPMALEVPDAPELEGFAVFRSRRVEDGRDRFRLHVGYFESPEDAERVLPGVRARYPAAWVSTAPPDSMGSLDDTGVAQFRFIRQNRSRTAGREKAPETRAPAPVAVAAALVGSGSPHHPPLTRTPMTSAQVLQLLESAPRLGTRQVARTAHQEPIPAPVASAQKFAVQLVWSTTPVLARSVPQLAIFEAYTLYSVQVEREGRRWYGLRLGFFKDPLSARQVALYARSDFSAAAVVPVSDRECARAGQVAAAALKIAAAPAPVGPTTRPTDEIVLKEEKPVPVAVAKTAATAARPTPVEFRAATPKPVLKQVPRPKVAAASTTGPQSRPKRRRSAKTAEELLEELGASELGIDTRTDVDELSESGVRHLSVAVVSRQSALARLLDRVGRKRDH